MTPEDGNHSLTVESECSDDECTVRCKGDVAGGGSAVLQRRMMELIPGRKLIVLDLSEVVSMDSMGLATLVRIHVKCKSAGCQLQLANASKRIMELLSLTNLLGIFA